MSVDLSMGAEFKERDLEEGLDLLIVFLHPFSGHEKGGGDLLFNQVVDQSLIVARSISYRAEVERQSDSGTRGGARHDHLGLREGRYCRDKQHCEGKA